MHPAGTGSLSDARITRCLDEEDEDDEPLCQAVGKNNASGANYPGRFMVNGPTLTTIKLYGGLETAISDTDVSLPC